MSISFLLLIRRRPCAGRYLDADISLLPDQGVPDVLPCRCAILHQCPVPLIEPQQRRNGMLSRHILSIKIFVSSHFVHYRDRVSHRGEIRKYKMFYLERFYLNCYEYRRDLYHLIIMIRYC